MMLQLPSVTPRQALTIAHDLIIAQPQPLLHRSDDAPVGLVRDDEIELVDGDVAADVFCRLRHAVARVLVHILTLHADRMAVLGDRLRVGRVL